MSWGKRDCHGPAGTNTEKDDLAAFERFTASRKGKPYTRPEAHPDEEGLDKRRELEELQGRSRQI